MSAGESERGPANAASHTMPDSAGALARGSGPGGRDMRTLGACVHALASTRTHRDAHRPALAARKPGWVPPWRSSRLASITRQDIAPRVMCAAERAHAARPLRPAPAREMERATGELPRKGAHTPRRRYDLIVVVAVVGEHGCHLVPLCIVRHTLRGLEPALDSRHELQVRSWTKKSFLFFVWSSEVL